MPKKGRGGVCVLKQIFMCIVEICSGLYAFHIEKKSFQCEIFDYCIIQIFKKEIVRNMKRVY